MSDARLKSFPRDLAAAARFVHLGAGVPTLLAHPDWKTPRPTVLWMHGRTANKELDPGRYLRWIRAGFAACAIDLPSHGERYSAAGQHPRESLNTIAQALTEIDGVVEALASPEFHGVFDLDRMGIGGMSLGGIIALRRLCDPHHFRAAAVEGTTGWLEGLYFPREFGVELSTGGPDGNPPPWVVQHDPASVTRVSAAANLVTFEPLPLLMLHSKADKMMPFGVANGFANRLRTHYKSKGAAESLVELHTWDETGAPEEHIGFGRFSNDAKNMQTAFFVKHLQA